VAEIGTDCDPGEDGCACLWCGRPFAARVTGGSQQRFCSAPCRHALDTAARRWVLRALEAGLLSVDMLKAAQTSARAVLEGSPRRLAPAQGGGKE
jgi:hypothetical protein